MKVVAHKTLLHYLPRPSREHQGNGGLLPDRSPDEREGEHACQQDDVHDRVPVLGVAPTRRSHRRCVPERHSERTMDVACEVAEALSSRDQGRSRDHQERHPGDQSCPYPRVLTPRARARLGGSYDRQCSEGRGHNANVYFHEDLEPGQCPEGAEQARAVPFRSLP